ncbi:MAG TPA: adenylate/guanylate cyclase domain-containing protein [Candidatus Angelobacter sp.]|nr:adenylate/guanylate cyclase domain-containing protein [Candidatus Angelobacter sp.]
MSELPTGTVTFFFSDIEGSTRLLQSCGARWPELLARHGAIVREALGRHGGVEVGTEGDSFFAAFGSAGQAVAAAVDVQRALMVEPWPAGESVRVRIGLHTGEASVVEATYVGLDVHRAARIMAAGHGGQVLVSGSTEALARASLEGVRLVDLGAHQLRDLPTPEHLFQVAADGLADRFPPLRGVTVNPTNLPLELTSFVGREAEAAAVAGLLREHRIVTLTGPGGTGKTRLSLHVAASASVEFPGGVYFVPLVELREVELVLPTIGQVLGIIEPGREPLERIPERVAGRRVLLVLDNLEQVVEAAPDLAELVRRAPELWILASSRIALRIYGAVEYPVPPLEMPDPRTIDLDPTIERLPAVALFVERARAVRPDFSITAENAAAVAEICWRLDGLPLAIELAAARVRILPPGAMVERMDRRLDLGATGMRDRPERQQTLRGAIAWSYDLLDEADRRFFACFSVFRGGADLEAIERVTMAGRDPLEQIASLLDKSLLRRDEGDDGATRFRMLETIREFAAERLDERADADAVRRAAAGHYLELAERLAPTVLRPQSQAVRTMEREHDNIRAGIAWSIEHDVEMALRWLPACWRFWQVRGHLPEAVERARAVLSLAGIVEHPKLLAEAEEAAGGIFYWQGDMAAAQEHYQVALDLQRQVGDEPAVANALYNLSSSIAVNFDDPFTPTDPAAQAAIDEALAIYRRLGDRAGEGNILWAAMNVQIFAREHDAVRRIGREALAIFDEVGNRFMAAWTHYMLGANENIARDPGSALPHFRPALEYFLEADDLSGFALVFDGFAASAYLLGDRPLAMRLAGAARAVQAAGGSQLGALNRSWNEFEPEKMISDPELAAMWDEGLGMSVSEAAELALGWTNAAGAER